MANTGSRSSTFGVARSGIDIFSVSDLRRGTPPPYVAGWTSAFKVSTPTTGLMFIFRLSPHFSHWIGGSGKVGLKAASGSDFLT